ncbi:MAG: aminopeptidase [Bdellovibrionaceae bacterium]|nr:aminopeptidase [Pseudobdellovibrionaceae bacterium]
MKIIFIISSLFLLPGCMVGYLLNSSYQQQKILRARTPIAEKLKDPSLDPLTKQKLLLVQETKMFAEKDLGLAQTNNYQSYVSLDRPYVTWIVQASEAFKLKDYQWWFPIVGHVPYKGYFAEESAQKEAKTFDSSKYDTYVRGVTAYSTLGWFNDPILTPMLRYENHDLVELIIHETVHATIYIKSQADFNERLATFIGQEGTKLFYLNKEGPLSATVKKIDDSIYDTQVFSEFITAELNNLRKWYERLEPKDKTVVKKELQIKAIQERFKNQIVPILRTEDFKGFAVRKLNNAILLSYETYVQDLSDFKKLFEKEDKDFKKFLNKCKELEKAEDPSAQLKQWLVKS